MGRGRRVVPTIGLIFCLNPATNSEARALPTGFIEETVVQELNKAVGVTFAPDGRMFVWEKGGKVWIVEDGRIDPEPLIDISDEVLDWWDHGLLGFAINPDFYNNGYVYLWYVVDWEWHVTGGKPDPAKQDKKHDTYGRLTRYTANAADDFHTVDYGTRLVLLGDSHDNGVPITSGSHGTDTALFAPDGMLLLSCGEGADFITTDIGGPRNSSFSTNTAETDGIISEKEQIGSYRAQLIDSHSGKILRIDPDTGAGVASNPFYDPLEPFSPRSKVYSLGFRNPFRFTIKPGTGSTNPDDGDSGILYIGDVGSRDWEEFSVAQGPAINFGWPVFEGLTASPDFTGTQVSNLDAPNPLYDGVVCLQEFFYFTDLLVHDSLNAPSWPNPCALEQQISEEYTFVHRRPELEWNHVQDLTRLPAYDKLGNATEIILEDSEVEGSSFRGVTSLGGVWYTGDKFPVEYRNVYFHGDSVEGWIRSIILDENDKPLSITEFLPSGDNFPVCLAVDPEGYGLYYVFYGFTGSTGEVRRITYDCNGNDQGDDLDIAVGESQDLDGDGIPDECQNRPLPCDGDANGDNTVDPLDAGFVLARLGCVVGAGDPNCDAADQNADGVVDPLDVGYVLARFGACE